MQILLRNRTERIWTEFKDENGVSVQPSGSVYVTVQYQDGSIMISEASATHSIVGRYYLDISPNAGWRYGYYGAWWRADNILLDITQDIPNVFKLEDPKESIIKGVMVERVRSSLYMHSDMGGFSNKFPRDRELLDYLQDSLNWWNAHPPAITFHDFSDVPTPYYSIIEQGATIKALEAMGIYEAGKHFIYNDNGISLTRDRSIKYQAVFGVLLQQYSKSLKEMRTKYALDHVRILGIFSSTTGFPRSLSRALRGVSKFS